MFSSVPVVEKSQKVDYQTPLKIISLKSQPEGCFAVLELIREDVTLGTRTCHAHNKVNTDSWKLVQKTAILFVSTEEFLF
jgi:hypothetical protein